MQSNIIEVLSREELPDDVNELTEKLVDKVHLGMARMQKFYSEWDTRLEEWEGERRLAETLSERQREKRADEPVKMVLPLTFAQTMTYVSMAMMMIKQRQRVYELKPVGPEDMQYREDAELILQRDYEYSNCDLVYFQHFLDIARLDLGILQTSFIEEMQTIPVQVNEEAVDTLEDDPDVVIKAPDAVTEYRRVRKFLGTRVYSVSPYKWYPDHRVALSKFHEGEYCACDMEYSRTHLEELEADETVAGLKHVQPMMLDARGLRNQTRFDVISPESLTKDTVNMFCVTEVQIKLIPSKTEFDGKPLGKANFPVRYLAWIANDNRLIRFQPMDYVHDKFTFEIAQFTPDQHKDINKALGGMVSKLQSTVDWYVNARVAAVRRTLDNQLVVDPSGVEMSTVEGRSRVILLKKGAGRAGVDRYVKQLQVQDSTTQHMSDVSVFWQYMQYVTGVNDQALGQFASGRRSATEARAVMQGAGARIRLSVGLTVKSSIEPIGYVILTNARAGFDEQEFFKIVGGDPMTDPSLIQRFDRFVPEDVTKLVGATDFFIYDCTLPTEKTMLAQTLQSLLETAMANPQTAMQLDLSAKALLDELLVLLGVGRAKQFSLSNDPQAIQQQYANLIAQSAATGNPAVQGASGVSGATQGTQGAA